MTVKRQFRFDARPLSGKLAAYVTPKEAYQRLNGQQKGAEAARLRMLRRMGIDDEDSPAADARERMIQRRERQER